MEPGKGCGDSPVIPAPLPGIMRAAGYDLGSSLTFQVVLNAGAAIGSIVVALLADRAGGFRVAITIYLGAAVVLVGTMATPTQAVLYLLIFLAGTGAQGGLVVLNSVVDRSYPPWLRAQALGLTLGIGRIGAIIAPSVVGLIVGQSTVGSFSLFASCAVAAAILITLARRSQGLKRVTEMEGGNVMPAQNF
jgi:MFS transporter, AAHS family, benzoate transport protein